MPRIYADNEQHEIAWGAVNFIEGVAALPEGADTAFWAHEYAVDQSKHARTVLDVLPKAQIAGILDYLGEAYLAGDTKQTLVRKVETFISTKMLVALTITSAAGTEIGDSLVTVTVGEIGTEGNTLAVKTGAAALTPLYMDKLDATWAAFTTPSDITPGNAAHTHVTVAELNAAGDVLAVGSVALTVNAGD